jgi:LPS-assembly lipoprotein
MKFLRAACLVSLLGLLAGCGFHSVYGSRGGSDGSPVAMELNDIAIDSIPEHNGQILRNALVDRMYGKNRSDQPHYRLSATLHSNTEDLGIQANATSTRELLNMYCDYKLKDNTGRQILSGTAHSVASYDRLDQMYGTIAAQQSATENTLHEVSEQIVNRLSLYFSEKQP